MAEEVAGVPVKYFYIIFRRDADGHLLLYDADNKDPIEFFVKYCRGIGRLTVHESNSIGNVLVQPRKMLVDFIHNLTPEMQHFRGALYHMLRNGGRFALVLPDKIRCSEELYYNVIEDVQEGGILFMVSIK